MLKKSIVFSCGASTKRSNPDVEVGVSGGIIVYEIKDRGKEAPSYVFTPVPQQTERRIEDLMAKLKRLKTLVEVEKMIFAELVGYDKETLQKLLFLGVGAAILTYGATVGSGGLTISGAVISTIFLSVTYQVLQQKYQQETNLNTLITNEN